LINLQNETLIEYEKTDISELINNFIKKKKTLLSERSKLNLQINRIIEEINVLEREKNGVHRKNILNDLSAKEWMKFKKSWFILDERENEWKLKKIHPATYPATIAQIFINFFTKKGNIVLDPMCGMGSTLTACDRIDRIGIGIDLNQKYCEIAKSLTKQNIICHDSKNLKELKIPGIDYCIFSPPYHDTLHKSKGGVITRHKDRIREGLDEIYSNDKNDLGNIHDEEMFLDGLEKITDNVYDLLKDRRFMTIIVQNEVGLNYNPIAWKIALKLSAKWMLKPERIWCQETKPVTIHGHPKTFVTNNHHHYCLNFQKILDKDTN